MCRGNRHESDEAPHHSELCLLLPRNKHQRKSRPPSPVFCFYSPRYNLSHLVLLPGRTSPTLPCKAHGSPKMRIETKKIPINGDRCVIQLVLAGDDQHRLNPDSIAVLNNALDEVEKDPSAGALLITNEGRFFSNGLDLQYLKDNPDKDNLIPEFQKLLQRILCFSIPTVAAICGHAVAGGCMLALAHDYRYMRSDRGFIFLNEVEIKLPLTSGMNAIIKSKLPVKAYHEAVLSGYRYAGKSAAESGVVNQALPDVSSTIEMALRKATELAAKNFDRSVYRAMKEEMFKNETQALLHGSMKGVPEILAKMVARL